MSGDRPVVRIVPNHVCVVVKTMMDEVQVGNGARRRKDRRPRRCRGLAGERERSMQLFFSAGLVFVGGLFNEKKVM